MAAITSENVPGCVAAASAVSFASIAACYTFVIHPGGMESGPAAYSAFFTKMFPKIARMQSALILVSSAGALVQAGRSPSAHVGWLGGAALLLGTLPWTFLRMMPANKAIMAAGERGEAAKLAAWGPLHAVRTVMGTASVALMAWALTRKG